MSLEIKPLTYAETEQVLEDLNLNDRTRVLKRADGKITFEKLDRSLSVDNFGQTD